MALVYPGSTPNTLQQLCVADPLPAPSLQHSHTIRICQRSQVAQKIARYGGWDPYRRGRGHSRSWRVGCPVGNRQACPLGQRHACSPIYPHPWRPRWDLCLPVESPQPLFITTTSQQLHNNNRAVVMMLGSWLNYLPSRSPSPTPLPLLATCPQPHA